MGNVWKAIDLGACERCSRHTSKNSIDQSVAKASNCGDSIGPIRSHGVSSRGERHDSGNVLGSAPSTSFLAATQLDGR